MNETIFSFVILKDFILEHALAFSVLLCFLLLQFAFLALSSIDNALILFCLLFSRAGESRGGGGNRGLCGSGNGCPTKEDNAMATIALC